MLLIEGQETDYQVLVSRIDEPEPCIDLKALLNQVCRKTAIDIVIDYQNQPQPALSKDDFLWLKSLPTTDVAQAYKQADS